MSEELYKQMAQSIIEGEKETAVELAQKSIEIGMPPLDAITKGFVVGVNYIGDTNLLLPSLQRSASARIINVSSNAHKYGRLDLDDLNLLRFYFGFWAYARSKLANILFTYELARRLQDSHVTVNALHPGRVGTDIFKTDFSIFGRPFKWLMERISLTPEQGADNTVYLAASPDVVGISGKYFVKREAVSSSSLSYDEELARRLWEKSEKVTGLS